MFRSKRCLPLFFAALLTASITPLASASTFSRADLAYLVAENQTIVVGEAVDARSYWNDDRSFILTDVRVTVTEVLKGSLAKREVTVTVPGGKVGELTSVIVGGAELQPGHHYVLFLRQGDLLGRRNVQFVREHGQGVFDVRMAGDGLRAVSQAHTHTLLPDETGSAEPVGGPEGLPFTTLIEAVRNLAANGRDNRAEVK